MADTRSVHGIFRGLFFTLAVFLLQGILNQPASCQTLSCPKPLAIPDRWDDEDEDGHYDHAEPLTVDTNGNGQYEPAEGDQYNDLNQDGNFDDTDEFYDPMATGYLAPGDVGVSLVLEAHTNGPIVPGQYFPTALPAINRGDPLTGAEMFEKWLGECSPFELAVTDFLLLEPGAHRDIVTAAFTSFYNQDPSAYRDSATQSVQGSQFAQSPRIVTLLAFDLPESGGATLMLTKFVSIFVQSIGPGARINTRIVDAGVNAPTPSAPTRWGILKLKY